MIFAGSTCKFFCVDLLLSLVFFLSSFACACLLSWKQGWIQAGLEELMLQSTSTITGQLAAAAHVALLTLLDLEPLLPALNSQLSTPSIGRGTEVAYTITLSLEIKETFRGRTASFFKALQ